MASAVVGLPFGRYRLIERIGEGGMAQVWKGVLPGAHDFQRVVVIKRILPELSRDPDFNKMFTREALLSARLNHPHIVQVFEFSSVEDQLFLAMEYVDGVNLIDVLKSLRGKDPMPLGFAAYVVRDVCRALAYAHALRNDAGQPLRLIHRDVTPSNVMISRDGVVKLLDFGIAKALSAASTDDRTRTGSLKGKLGYLSPELVEGDVELDQRADIFAAGIVLHELLCGRRLFKGVDDIRTLALVRSCQVPKPSTLRAEITAELDRICMKALARDRDERYADAGTMATDLSNVAHAMGWDQPAAERFIEHARITRAELKPEGEARTLATPTSPEISAPIAIRGRPIKFWYTTAGVAAALIASLAFLVGRRDKPAPVVTSIATAAPAPPTLPDPPTLKVEPPAVKPAKVERAIHAPVKSARRPAHAAPIKDVGRGELVNPFSH